MQYRYDEPGVKNNSPDTVKPNLNADQLELQDVVPGAAIEVRNINNRTDRKLYVIAGYPFLNVYQGCLTVKVQAEGEAAMSGDRYTDQVVRLSDLGITPRPDGTWDQEHYTLLRFRWKLHESTLSGLISVNFRGYRFDLAGQHPVCGYSCCALNPLEYISVSRPGYSPAETVRLTTQWQDVLYIQVKQKDYKSILIRTAS